MIADPDKYADPEYRAKQVDGGWEVSYGQDALAAMITAKALSDLRDENRATLTQADLDAALNAPEHLAFAQQSLAGNRHAPYNDYDGEPYPGRWYFYGIKRFCELAEKYGYKIIDEDVAKDFDELSPIIHFKKG